MNVSTLVRAAALGALSFLLMRLEVPLVPGFPFLKYDPSALPALVAAFVLGLPAGIAVVAVRAALFALFFGDPVGVAMGLAASLLFLVPAERVYRSRRDFRGGMLALSSGTLAMAAGMIPANWVVVTALGYLPSGQVPFYCLAVVPGFNLLKGALDGLLLLLVYKRAGRLLRPAATPSPAGSA